MKKYEHALLQDGFEVVYIEAADERSDVRKLIEHLGRAGIRRIRYCSVTDDWLQRRMDKACSVWQIEQSSSPDPNFMNSPAELNDYFNNRKTYFQTDFYIWQRKSRKILLEGENLPLGGKWTFDSDNRKRFPKTGIVPQVGFPPADEFTLEATGYVERNWPANYGSSEGFDYPADSEAATNWLQQFFRERFSDFGVYEDAMVADESILFHSRLTPMLNIGLLQPGEIITRALEYASENPIPLNSLEGFVRQVLGWREFTRAVYQREGRRQRTRNFWNFTRTIPYSFWEGTTGIAPVDIVIRKTLQHGYNHHIERLMVLGNFMLLCEFDPDDVYRWFMEMYVDAYDWVMVPNVYGMTQFADGGLMTTKPYISGSNYLMKMGDWPKGEWQQTWDGLFWRFLHVHRSFFLSNPRLGLLVSTFDKMSSEKKQAHLERAEKFLQELDNTAA